MPKAINWPSEFLEEVINENTSDVKAAIRLGTIYYDHCYYVPDEEVDIRVNHKIVRQGQIFGEMKLTQISDLTEDDLGKLKESIQDIDRLKSYLSKTYEEEVTDDTTVCVVYYKNLLTTEDNKAEDPHM